MDAPKVRTQPNPSLLESKREPGKSLADILWGAKHRILSYRSPSIKDAGALVDGNCQSSEAYHQFGEGETYFELDEAKTGEYDSFNKYGWLSQAVVPDSTFRMEGRSTSIPSFSQNAVFLTANTSNVFVNPPAFAFAEIPKSAFLMDSTANSFANPTATKHKSTFPIESAGGGFRGTHIAAPSDRSESEFSSAGTSANIAPAFAGQSIQNTFASAQNKTLMSSPATVNSPDGCTFQREDQPLSFLGKSATPSQPGVSNDIGENPLFLGGENALSDEEAEEVETFSAPTGQTSWTSFLPGKVESSSSKLGATSLFDQKAVFPSTFQFTNPTIAQPTAKNPLQAAPSIQQVPTFKPFSNVNTTNNIFRTENKDPSTFTFGAVESISKHSDKDMVTKPGQRDESTAKETVKREEASAREAHEREKAIAREAREREAIAREAREREAIVREVREREEALEKKAEGIFNRHLIEKYFYLHVERARRQKRRTDRILRKKHRTAYAEDLQWWPIIKDGALYKDSVCPSLVSP